MTITREEVEAAVNDLRDRFSPYLTDGEIAKLLPDDLRVAFLEGPAAPARRLVVTCAADTAKKLGLTNAQMTEGSFIKAPRRRCALYRHFDGAGVLLYIGISEAIVGRGKQHAATAEWARFVATTAGEWHPSRTAALAAERAAIKAERPLFNRQYNDWPGAEKARSAYLATRSVRWIPP